MDLTEQLEVSSGEAAAVSRVHLRSENTPWRPLFMHRIVVGKRHPGPCRTRPGQFTSSLPIARISLARICATVLHDLGVTQEMVRGLAQLP